MTRLATKIALLTAAALAAVAAAPVAAQNVTITNARLVIGDGTPPIDGATIVVRDGKVVAAGRGVASGGGQVVDADGAFVTPGIVAGFSRLGLADVDAVDSTNDRDSRNALYHAALDVAPVVNAAGVPVGVNRAAGVTRAFVFPGESGDIFRGRGALVDLGADRNMVTRPRLFQFADLGAGGADDAGGSRAAAMVHFREMLAEAARYARNPAGFQANSRQALLSRADAEALSRVLSGAEKLVVRVDRASDILAVIDLKRSYPNIQMVLAGATEGWLVAREIAASGLPVITSALTDLPGSFDTIAATQSNVGRMRAAGVPVTVGVFDDDDLHKVHYAPQYAGNLVALTKVPGATGLSWDQAFAAITSEPARALGVDGVVGSLRPGRVGDIVVWSGDPLEVSSRPTMIWIDGVRQPLTNRQERLRDRYLTPTESELPKAYDR